MVLGSGHMEHDKIDVLEKKNPAAQTFQMLRSRGQLGFHEVHQTPVVRKGVDGPWMAQQ